jgi:hypothetical protein
VVVGAEPPGAPSKLEVVNVTSRSVSLKWVKPFDGNSELLTYILQYKDDTGKWA